MSPLASLKRASIACAWKDTKATAPTIQFKKLLRMIRLYVEKKQLANAL
jgi:hypothetical protein